LVRVREGVGVGVRFILNITTAVRIANQTRHTVPVRIATAKIFVIYYDQALGAACVVKPKTTGTEQPEQESEMTGTTETKIEHDRNKVVELLLHRFLVSMRKSHCIHLAFLFPNFLNMSLTFRIYKTTIRPSFHLMEFNKQIVLFSCKFEKKIALFRLAFPCLPSY
jgi:hypothetical protein